VPAKRGYEALVAAGRIVPEKRRLDDVPPPAPRSRRRAAPERDPGRPPGGRALSVWHVGSSALAETVIRAPDSASLRRSLGGRALVACDPVRAEAVRAARLHDPATRPSGAEGDRDRRAPPLGDDVYARARRSSTRHAALARRDPPRLGAPLEDDLGGIVTDDERLAAAAHGVAVSSPR
jgi:hypothetical protein